jgi:hypothetical protein
MRGLWLAALFVACLGAQTSAPLPDDYEADFEDEAIVNNVLRLTIQADDIYVSSAIQDFVLKQAERMAAAAQRRLDRQQKRIDAAKAAIAEGKAEPATLPPLLEEMQRRLESARQAFSRRDVLKDIVDAARAERERKSLSARRGGRGTARGNVMTRYDGSGRFTALDLRLVASAFSRRFHRALPISAAGTTGVHRSLGFDHRGRIDVPINPDDPEGVWLRQYLEALRIPYYAFRAAVRGSATGPHIHIGPGSTRTVAGGSD